MEQKHIIYGAYDDKLPGMIEENELRVYPSLAELEKASTENNLIINLADLSNRNCKKCNGTGILGYSKPVGNAANISAADNKQIKHFALDEWRKEKGVVIRCHKCFIPNLRKAIIEKIAIINLINKVGD